MLAAQVQDDRENEPADLGIIMPAVDEVQHVADVILGEAAPGVQPHPQAHRFWPGDRGYGGLVGGPGLIKMSLVGLCCYQRPGEVGVAGVFGQDVAAHPFGLRPVALLGAVVDQAAAQHHSLLGREVPAREQARRERVSLADPVGAGQYVQLVVRDLPAAETADGPVALCQRLIDPAGLRQHLDQHLCRSRVRHGVAAQVHHRLIEASLRGVVASGKDPGLDIIYGAARLPGRQVGGLQVTEHRELIERPPVLFHGVGASQRRPPGGSLISFGRRRIDCEGSYEHLGPAASDAIGELCGSGTVSHRPGGLRAIDRHLTVRCLAVQRRTAE